MKKRKTPKRDFWDFIFRIRIFVLFLEQNSKVFKRITSQNPRNKSTNNHNINFNKNKCFIQFDKRKSEYELKQINRDITIGTHILRTLTSISVGIVTSNRRRITEGAPYFKGKSTDENYEQFERTPQHSFQQKDLSLTRSEQKFFGL